MTSLVLLSHMINGEEVESDELTKSDHFDFLYPRSNGYREPRDTRMSRDTMGKRTKSRRRA